ncbi:MAG: hypothetical protein N4A65_16455 [Cohaesibacter sp.]|jgi:DNA-binding CsgD family transcriptional regulator|nr:hypothetical protein [Cohaesibacter sp.]
MQIFKLEQYNLLLDRLYDYATDDKPLSMMADILSDEYPEVCVGLFGYDFSMKQEIAARVTNIPNYMESLFFEHYQFVAPWTQQFASSKAGDIIHTQQIISMNDLYQTEYYNDFLRAIDGRDRGAGSMLFQEDGRALGIGYMFEKQYDEHLTELDHYLKKLIPHLRRVMDIKRKMGQFFIERTAAQQVLDQLSGAVFLLDNSGKVIYFNRNAQNFLDRYAKDIKIVKDQLLWSASPNASKFRLAFATSETEETGARKFVSDPFVLHFNNGERRTAFMFRSRATNTIRVVADDKETGFHILFIDNPEQLDHLNPQALYSLYQLTPAESRLVIALCKGSSLQDYAEHSQISINTARNQMRSILQKTEDRKQTQMIQKVMNETKLRSLFK